MWPSYNSQETIVKPIGLLDVKVALNDSRFRDSLPKELSEDVTKYLQNPACACNVPIYRKIFKLAKNQLKQYFPGREILEAAETNTGWTVINCHIIDLENRLRSLPPGPKQIAISRYEDQVTVIVHEPQ